MNDFTDLKNAIKNVIKANGAGEITGDVLQQTLVSIVDNLGKYAAFKGIASPTTTPGSDDGNVFFIAATAGTYANFNGAELEHHEIALFTLEGGSWQKTSLLNMNQTVANASAALSTAQGAETLAANAAHTAGLAYARVADIPPAGGARGVMFISDVFDFNTDLSAYSNRTWVIRHRHQLEAGTITIPENVTLKFDGGILEDLYINAGAGLKIEAPDDVQCFAGMSSEPVFLRPVHARASAKWFGAKGDGVQDDTIAISQCTFSFSDVFIPEGNYIISDSLYVSEGLRISGAGKHKTVINGRDNGVLTCIKQFPAPVELNGHTYGVDKSLKALTQSTDVLKGATDVTVTNTCSAGNVLKIASGRKFLENWESVEDPDRPHEESELIPILKATSSLLDLKESVNFGSIVGNGALQYFAIENDLTIQDLTLKASHDAGVDTKGVDLDGWTNVNLLNLQIEECSHGAIALKRCLNAKIQGCTFLGAAARGAGAETGVKITDGCKDIFISDAEVSHTKESVQIGNSAHVGLNEAVVMRCTVEKLRAEQYTYYRGVVFHANSAYCTAKNILGCVSASGLGHTVENVKAYAANASNIAVYGGAKSTFKNIQLGGANRFMNIRSIKNSYFENIRIELIGPVGTDIRSGGGNNFVNFSIINTSFDPLMTRTQADATIEGGLGAGFTPGENDVVNGLYVEGFPIGVSLENKGVHMSDVHLINSGWPSDQVDDGSGLFISRDAEGSIINGLVFNNSFAHINETDGNGVFFSTYGDGGRHVTLCNIKELSSQPFKFAWHFEGSNFNDLTIFNTYLSGTVSGTMHGNSWAIYGTPIQ